MAWTLCGLLFACSCASAASVSEQQLKSAFLYNFTKFVEWPPESFASPGDPIVIGLLGDESMFAEISAIVGNRQVNGRPLLVRQISVIADARLTHVLFIPAAEQRRFTQMKAKIADRPVLTVGETEQCVEAGNSICFIQQDDKLRFEINIDTAQRCGLKISAQLQKLALAVHRGT